MQAVPGFCVQAHGVNGVAAVFEDGVECIGLFQHVFGQCRGVGIEGVFEAQVDQGAGNQHHTDEGNAHDPVIAHKQGTAKIVHCHGMIAPDIAAASPQCPVSAVSGASCA